MPRGLLVMPTFTYSFTKGEVSASSGRRRRSGVLTEHFRRLPGVRRTPEPIFSTALLGAVPGDWERPLCSPFGEQGLLRRRERLRPAGGRRRVARVPGRSASRTRRSCTAWSSVPACPTGTPSAFPARSSRQGRRRSASPRPTTWRRLDEDVISSFGPLGAELRAAGHLREGAIPKGPRLLLVRARAVTEIAQRGRSPATRTSCSSAGTWRTPGTRADAQPPVTSARGACLPGRCPSPPEGTPACSADS